MALSSIEKETVIVFNEGEQNADIETFNAALLRKLEALAKERPNEVQLVKASKAGCRRYTFPKKWVKINPTRILTEAEKQRLIEHARNVFNPE